MNRTACFCSLNIHYASVVGRSIRWWITNLYCRNQKLCNFMKLLWRQPYLWCIIRSAVAQRCVNGDTVSQWEGSNFDPLQSKKLDWCLCQKLENVWWLYNRFDKRPALDRGRQEMIHQYRTVSILTCDKIRTWIHKEHTVCPKKWRPNSNRHNYDVTCQN